MRYAKFYTLGIILLMFISELPAQQIHIPDDLLTIQEGIDRSVDGDTVLVAPGEYFENINLRGRNIVLGSFFISDGNLEHINNTIINGSRPVHEDTASCILIVSGENENCVVAGFTLTGGKGTRWEDEHNRGNWFTEGGGILIQYSSPTIRNNVIRDNEAILKNHRNLSSGGGAIRMGDSNPKILNNYIHHNKGRYGGGIVLNYSGALIKNNLIVSNSGGQDFGGGGVWILGNSAEPRIMDNNTIVNNSSSNVGGGVRIWTSSVVLTNNIIRGNHATQGRQVHGTGIWTYCNIEGGKEGEGNIDQVIRFDSPLMFLPDGDLSIDAGNPHVSYNDPEDPDVPTSPLFPSKGTLRNDMGAYGGPGAMGFPEPDLTGISSLSLDNHSIFSLFPNPASGKVTLAFSNTIKQGDTVDIFSLSGSHISQVSLNSPTNSMIINLNDHNITTGIYIIRIARDDRIDTKRLIVY